MSLTTTDMDALRLQVKEQGDLISQLKESGAPKQDIDVAVRELKARKKKLEDMELAQMPVPEKFDRAKLEDLLRRRFFYTPAFEIYGGVAGLYDFGPMGCAMEANMLTIWRSHFILEDQMLEVRCTQLTPHQVLKASGHVDRFADFMVKDTKTGECYRADHLLKAHMEKLSKEKGVTKEQLDKYDEVVRQIDNYNKETLNQVMKKYNVRATATGNEITEPLEFNLMFSTSIGPSGLIPGFLRPETAQGIFLNFKRLLEFNNGRLPFASAQIGCGFRNEISPRSGLLRVREFIMAEIEHFVDPKDKSHSKFGSVKNEELLLYPRDFQMKGEPPIKVDLEKAVSEGFIFNTTVAYFLGRIHQFMLKIGVDPAKVRFRQHMQNEMAHYASDCWDCELLTSYGWVECVGCADRACYDLCQHTQFSGEKLTAQIPLDKPMSVDCVEVVLDKAAVGKEFRQEAQSILKHVESFDVDAVNHFETEMKMNGSCTLSINGATLVLRSDLLKEIRRTKKEIYVREVEPHVIEPSFGIGRIMYAVLEHNFCIRDGDEQRQWLSLPPIVAPLKCVILPLSNNPEFAPVVGNLSSLLTELDISHKVDDSAGSIGRRYARSDEIAIPFAITVDFDTINKTPHTATLRDRNTTRQIRVQTGDLPLLLLQLTKQKLTWAEVEVKFGLFEGQETITRAEK